MQTTSRPGSGTVTAVGDTYGFATVRRGASWNALGGAMGALVALLGFILGSRPITDNSLLTHLATGRLILDGRTVPKIDPYSWTAAGEPWTVQSWLASLLYSVVFDQVGEWALRLLNGLLVAAVAYVMWRLADSCHQVVPRVALVGTAVVAASTVWSPRPLLFGLLAFGLLLLVLQRALAPWTLIPVMWIWVNTHGSFPLAIVAIAAFGMGDAIDRRRLPRHELRILGWTVAGMAAGAVNPLGFRVLWFPVHLLGRRQAIANVAEWQSPDFSGAGEWAFLLLIGGLLYAAIRGARTGALVPGFLFLVAGLIAIRNLGPASLVLVAVIAPWIETERSMLDVTTRGMLPKALVAVAVVGALLVGSVTAGEAAFDLELYPVEEVDWLDDRGLVATGDVRIVHRPGVGNYLELRFGTEARVFADDRFDFYPQDVLDDVDELLSGSDYRDVLDRRNIDVVLWENGTAFASWLEEADEWAIGVEDDDWLVACRVDSPAADPCLR